MRNFLMTIASMFVVISAFVLCFSEIKAISEDIDNVIDETEYVREDLRLKCKEYETETELPACVYTNEDYEILAHVINGEAESNSYDLKLGVGSVVLNRVNDQRFPNTIKEVVFQSGQYACTWDGNYDKTPVEDSYKAALELLENGSVYPKKVIWQANHKQGTVYAYFENTYFCY